MSATLLEMPRTGKHKTDAKAASNGINGAVPRTTGTRRRNRERLDKDNQQEIPEDTLEEGSAEGVWFDGPLALTLLPPLGSFLTGGSSSRFAEAGRRLSFPSKQATLSVMALFLHYYSSESPL